MVVTNLRTILMGAALAALVGCSAADLFGSSAHSHDDPALVIFYGDTSRVAAPDTVARGTSFGVSFTTYGGGCTRAISHTDVTITGNVAVIRPYDRTDDGPFACPDILLLLTHSAQLNVDAPGSFTIRVIGQQRGASTGSANGPAEVTRLITVR
jgi:hypothetical protein